MAFSIESEHKVVIIGAGFTGLAAAYELSLHNIPAVVIEKDDAIGGLGGSFKVGNERLDKFYHHWFNNDCHALQLAKELNCQSELLYNSARTSVYYDENFYKMASPIDVLRFKPLSFLDRIRLGLLALKVKRIKDYRALESITAKDWLIDQCGPEVYRVVWQPLLKGKFGDYASQISAVWFWKKLVLRGGSRDKLAREQLVYFNGGWAAFADLIAEKITSVGGEILTHSQVQSLDVTDGAVTGVKLSDGRFIQADTVIATPSLPVVADIIDSFASKEYLDKLRSVEYLANICLVLEMSHNLSDYYWINVNDLDFPFVGIIEHTNFQSRQKYDNRHIVYLSRYLRPDDKLYSMSKDQVFEFSVPYIKKMFPNFRDSWVCNYRLFKARYAQPIVDCNYKSKICPSKAPIDGLYITTMAQIYPEDRGTNYAIAEGRKTGKQIADVFKRNRHGN